MKYFRDNKKAYNAFLIPVGSQLDDLSVPSPNGMKNSGSLSQLTVVIVTGYLCVRT